MKKLLLPFLFLSIFQNSVLCTTKGHYVIAGIEMATAAARAGAVISDSGFVESNNAKVEKSGKLSKKGIVALARIVNEIASFWSYKSIKEGNDHCYGTLDLGNNLRYANVLWVLQDAYSLYSDLKKFDKQCETSGIEATLQKNKKREELVKLFHAKILPAVESVATIVRAAESLRDTSDTFNVNGKFGFIGKSNIDYLCTVAISLSRILDEMISYEKFSVRQALIIAQAVILVGAAILDFCWDKCLAEKGENALKQMISSIFEEKYLEKGASFTVNIHRIDTQCKHADPLEAQHIAKGMTIGDLLSSLGVNTADIGELTYYPSWTESKIVNLTDTVESIRPTHGYRSDASGRNSISLMYKQLVLNMGLKRMETTGSQP